MVKSSAVTVTTSPTRLDTTVETSSFAGSGREQVTGQSIVAYNNGTAPVHLGGPDVTPATGLPVHAGTYGPAVDLAHLDEGLYAVAAAGTVEVRVLEVAV